jgi:SAM-dependent methyltransferase
MQNVVYDFPALARECASGILTLVTCRRCGHTFNRSFDPSLVAYDQNYNNNVPSKVMDRYYGEIADYLYQKYDLRHGSLVDVGCGKGLFLRKLGKQYADVSAVGIDPSYEGAPGLFPGSKLTFIPDIFKPEQLDSRPSLILCRHVLEHIFDLPQFLRDIRSALRSWLPLPFFIEVPDLNWTVNHHAFWDFCYEHCNYFTPDSIGECLRLNGFNANKTTSAFGGQYLWIEGFISSNELGESSDKTTTIASTTERLQTYVSKEQDEINRIRAFLLRKKDEKRHIVVWGMATKGVLFNYLIDPDSKWVDQCVDINQDKQGKFLPITGKLIQHPQTIAEQSSNPVIIVMNPNYKAEIMAQCRTYGLEAEFYDMDQP